MTVLTTIYTAPYKRIVVKHMADDSAEVSSMGEVSEAEEMAAVEAEGRSIVGWKVEYA
jgi:hypothetical protein